MAGSEYLELIHGLVAGRPTIDLDLEVKVQQCCRQLVTEGLISSAHDCSEGGLGVAIAESAVQGNLGFTGSVGPGERWDAALFGEAASRILLSLDPANLQAVEAACRKMGVPYLLLGTVGGDRFSFPNTLDSFRWQSFRMPGTTVLKGRCRPDATTFPLPSLLNPGGFTL